LEFQGSLISLNEEEFFPCKLLFARCDGPGRITFINFERNTFGKDGLGKAHSPPLLHDK